MSSQPLQFPSEETLSYFEFVMFPIAWYIPTYRPHQAALISETRIFDASKSTGKFVMKNSIL